MWAAARAFTAASHRGGTLTVVNEDLPVPDPVLADDPARIPHSPPSTTAWSPCADPGARPGLTLVPDLAVALPRPAGGGTTYTFTLRPGIRYSNGTPVRASDFRRGIQRQLSFGANPGYYEGILGGQTCHQHPQRCDLSAGIITNDAARTVTFHLADADPDFLLQTRAAPRRASAARCPGPGHPLRAVPARHRPLQDLAIPAGRILHPGAEPVLPAMVIRRPASRLPGCHPLRPSGQPSKQESEVIAGRADLAPVGEQRSVSRDPVPGPRAHGLKYGRLQFVPQHPPAAVYQPQGPASRQLRHRPRPDPPVLTTSSPARPR